MTGPERRVAKAAMVASCLGVFLGAGILAWQYWAWPRLYEREVRRDPSLNIALRQGPEDEETASRLLAWTVGYPLLGYFVLAHLGLALFAIAFCIGDRPYVWLLPQALAILVLVALGMWRCFQIFPSFVD